MIYFNEQTRQFGIFNSDPIKKKAKLEEKLNNLKRIQAMSPEDKKVYYGEKGKKLGGKIGAVTGGVVGAHFGAFSNSNDIENSQRLYTGLIPMAWHGIKAAGHAVGTGISKVATGGSNAISNGWHHVSTTSVGNGLAGAGVGGTAGYFGGKYLGRKAGELYGKYGDNHRKKRIAKLESKIRLLNKNK